MEDDTLFPVDAPSTLFPDDNILDDLEFLNIVKRDEEFYTMFLNLRGFKKHNSNFDYEKESKKIYSYADFLQSPCQIILLCADVVFYEIYVKNKDVLKQIKLNAEKSNFEDIEYITDENDGRYKKHVH
ncbi:hypothetical protein SDC9_206289 [bioreactor metagenome]|uniref:Uncharacterized protein n=1 Tax=bioreactor metagenome TaxID=1076179 RepID=A0A645J635_9ZZZZ